MNVGYSGTPLVKKIGFKENDKVLLINPPINYYDLVRDLPQGVLFINKIAGKVDIVHFFTIDVNELYKSLPTLRNQIKENGMIWVSWPKKSSKVISNVTEDIIREAALSIRLVDVKVCAIDATWSGLKLVIPIADRK